MYQYRTVREIAFDPYIGVFVTYGLKMSEDGRHLLTEHDVSVDRQVVEDIAAVCTAEQVEPVHIMDVILNMLP